MTPERSAQIDALLARYADVAGPGAALLVIEDSKVAMMKCYGSADVDVRTSSFCMSAQMQYCCPSLGA